MAEGKAHSNKRKAISKKVRFEVFKRDGFQCLYCGRTPPTVFLQIDHIRPVADGGDNHQDNLATSCTDCNQGKGARSLLAVPQSLRQKSVEMAEREAQIQGYQKILDARRARLDAEVMRVVGVYEKHDDGFTLSDSARLSVRKFIEHLGVHECMESMEHACAHLARRPTSIFKYFCGICWNKIRRATNGEGA